MQARRLTAEQLSERLGIKSTELHRELRRDPEPKPEVLKFVARELALPPFVFYMEHLPPLEEVLPDFRALTPTRRAKSRDTIEAIKLAEGIQKTLRENKTDRAAPLPKFTATTNEGIERFALRMRDHLGISVDEQRQAKDARQFYVTVRRKIEDFGITVLQDSFPEGDGSGFCLADHNYPVILINSKKQTRGRRLFTLAHELAHVLMGESGISDPGKRDNVVEKRCNRFATSFLVPAPFLPGLLGVSIVRDPDLEDVKFAARKLKISQEATVLRLEELNPYEHGSHSKWKALVSDNNPDFSKEAEAGLRESRRSRRR